MKLVVFNKNRLGALQEDKKVIDLNKAYAAMIKRQEEIKPYAKAEARVPSNLLEFIKEGERGVEAVGEAVAYVMQGNELGPKGEKLIFKTGEYRLRAPLPSRASKMAMAGANFYDHSADVARMFGGEVTIEDLKKRFEAGEYPPWGFWKHVSNVIGPEEPILYPDRTERLDYEVEVAAIISKKGKDIPEEKAMEYIYGYTILNDISIRDSPRTETPNGLFLTKNFDGSAPMGPCIVTADEIGDPHTLKMRQTVSGKVRQNGSMESMIRRFPWWISYLSRDMTLYPGDIICGGTCSGTALDTSPVIEGKTKPDNFLKIGDVLEARVEKIGTLRNQIVEKR